MTDNTTPSHPFPADPSKINLTYIQRRHILRKDDDEVECWEVSADVHEDDQDGEPHVISHVGDFLIYVFDPYEAPGWKLIIDGLVDGGEQIVKAIGEPGRSAPLREEVEDMLDPFGSAYLVLASARLMPEWRGRGLGAFLAGAAIQTLGRGCRGAFLVPGSLPSEPTPADRDLATQKLRQVWASLGFVPLTEDVYVLNLGLRTFEENMTKLQQSLGLG